MLGADQITEALRLAHAAATLALTLLAPTGGIRSNRRAGRTARPPGP